MGAELEDFAITGAYTFSTSTVSTYADASFVRGVIFDGSGSSTSDNASAPLASSATELWAHSATYHNLSSAIRILMLSKSGGAQSNDRIGLKFDLAATPKVIQIVKFDGTTETVLATSSGGIVTTNTKYTLDLYVKLGASAIVTGYLNGTQVVTWTGDLTALTANVDWVRFSGTAISEAIVHTEDTRQMRLQTRAPNAAGDSNTFTAGAYTAIDETPADLSDTIYSGTAAQVFQCKFPALPTAPSGGWVVRARKSTILAVKGLDAGPSSLDFGEKTNSTAYYPTTVALANGWTPASLVEETNPATSARYTAAEAAAIQLSLRSV